MGDFTKDEKEEKQYPDTMCSEAEGGPGGRLSEVLYDYIVDPAASQCWETYPSALTDTILCLK